MIETLYTQELPTPTQLCDYVYGDETVSIQMRD